MGNTFSTTVRSKLDNNGKIWQQTIRNAQTAALLGLFLTFLKYRKSLFQCFKRQKSENDKNKKNKMNKRELFLSIFKFFIKFPLFTAVFSITFKKMMRMNYISHALDIDLESLPKQKYSITLMSFLLAYYMQSNVGVFSYKWALLLLIRAIYGLIRLQTPVQSQIFSVQDFHTVLGAAMGCIFVGKNAKTLPSSIKATYAACYWDYHSKWQNWYTSNHCNLPSCSCWDSFHEMKNQNCIKSYFTDALFTVFPHSMSFFLKLHFMASVLSGYKFLKDLKTNPLRLGGKVLKGALRSSAYWAIGVHLAVRVCSCFNRVLVNRMSKIFNSLMNTPIDYKYAYVNEKNFCLQFFVTSLVGRYTVLVEPKGRQIEIVLSLIWYQICHILRMNCELETNDDASYHWLLGANSFPSILFAMAFGINIYVFCKDAKYMKSMERNLISKFLIK